ncbi:MAG: transaldolase [Acidobacteria bacterium]|nr:MAG: transaldolase [Acidobacteriota bacterium]
MNSTTKLFEMGQSIWLDSITRDMLTNGTLAQYIKDFSVTGLTSNPTIFDHAIKNTNEYDHDIRKKSEEGLKGESLFLELELDDLRRAADLFRPIHEQTSGVDGWVSLELSPLLAQDTAGSVAAAKEIYRRANRPNIYIKIPGTKEGVPAIEESLFAGVPINVTLLFSREQYLESAEAYVRAMERRIAAGLKPDVHSVASLFISRWDVAVKDKVPEELRNRLGIAIAKQTYDSYRQLLDSPRVQRIMNAGARPQRLLWASTGTKDPKAPELLYVDALAAPLTINTMPEKTLLALSKQTDAPPILSTDQTETVDVFKKFAAAGIDTNALAAKLQEDGAKAFVDSWNDLLQRIASKSSELAAKQ